MSQCLCSATVCRRTRKPLRWKTACVSSCYLSWPRSEHGANIFHQPVEGERLVWECLKTKVLVEFFSFSVLGMNQQGTDSNNVGDLEAAAHGVCHQSRPKPFALPGLVNRKAGKQEDGNRVARKPLGHTVPARCHKPHRR